MDDDMTKRIDAWSDPQPPTKQDQLAVLFVLFIVFIIAFWLGYFLR